MGRIRILPDSIANKIAAGEVVERPASAVKELVENALDAGGSRIRVEVEAGGRKLLRVLDDGSGMVRDDALLAFERHATSKLRTAEDLLSVATLGFRGEALPSIAAVSRLTLETRAAGEPSGTRVEINGGRLMDVREAGLPPGTAVTVRDLFYNIPARRKFLRSESTELSHVASLVTHYALAHPERQFSLRATSGELLNVTPVETHRERLFQIFGGETLEQLVELGTIETELALAPPVSGHSGFTPEFPSGGEGAAAEPAPETKILCLAGFISRPQFQKLNRNAIYIFVNRRLIRDRLVLHAISEAYRNLIPPATFPLALLFLDVPFDEVDVNVHPSKVEVRFRHQAFVHDFVRDALRRRLTESRPVSTFPVSAPPALEPQSVLPRPASGFALAAPPIEPQARRLPLSAAPPLEFSASAPAPAPLEPPAIVATAARNDELAGLRPLGQIQESFIVAAGEDALWIVDQHVAHERVLFEKTVRERAAGRGQSQRLLMPHIIQLSPAQQAALEEIRAEMEANGFEIEPFGQRTVAVKSAPAGIVAGEIELILRELLDGVDNTHCSDLALHDTDLDAARRRVAASIACHAAIKINTPLDQRKMQWLLDELARTESPMSCPHGRPVVLKYPIRDILKAFHRL